MFPSCYEVFPLVVLEAAAAGLPIVVTQMNGVEDFLEDGKNGLLVTRSVEGVAAGLAQLAAMPAAARRALGEQAVGAIQRFGTAQFVSAWREVYDRISAA